MCVIMCFVCNEEWECVSVCWRQGVGAVLRGLVWGAGVFV